MDTHIKHITGIVYLAQSGDVLAKRTFDYQPTGAKVRHWCDLVISDFVKSGGVGQCRWIMASSDGRIVASH